ncbi:MAG: ThiF family adenylyltransferase [Thermodesulfobacteriota bacterium]|nr:MAG: ThiF family adenylyltransferase [Thermodesulfobacteriota bacterium]
MPKPWFEREPDLLETEKKAYLEGGMDFRLNEELLVKKKVVVFEGTIQASDGEHRLQVIYPSGFPDTMPLIRDLSKVLPRHQEPYSGVLCIEQKKTGADRVLEALDLINVFNERPQDIEDLEIDAPEPASIYYPYNKLSTTKVSSVLIPSTMTHIPMGSWGDFALRLQVFNPTIHINEVMQTVLYKVHDASSNKTYSINSEALQGVLEMKGQWLKVKTQPPFLNDYGSFKKWFFDQESKLTYRYQRLLDKMKQNDPARDFDIFGIVYPEEGPKRREYVHDQWLIGVESKKHKIKALLRPSLLGVEDAYFQRIPSLIKLREKKVVLVGLGAIGSVIATELARAGIGHFCLIDFDGYDAGNVVRQAVDLRMTGMAKVDAIARQIKLINPFAKVKPWGVKLGMPVHDPESLPDGEGDDLSIFSKLTAEYDLIISTIADKSVEFLINDILTAAGKPGIYAYVHNGAWGGQIFRALPNEACFECFGYHKSDMNTGNVNEDPLAQPLYARGCCFPTFTGTGFDTSVISNLATRFAVQTLLRNENGYPDVDYNLINWSSRTDSKGDLPNLEKRNITKHNSCRFHKSC